MFHKNKNMAEYRWQHGWVVVAICIIAGKRHMGKKDTIGKLYFRNPERFAELMNVAVFQGEKIVRPENLIPMEREYPSVFGTNNKNRDILMKDRSNRIMYALELEAESDYSMPERVMVYDACEYERQIRQIVKKHKAEQTRENYREKKSRIKENDFLFPVVTVVLYLGNHHWEAKQKMSELFRIPKKVRHMLKNENNEYGFHLLEADYVSIEDYETDLREFFQAMQCRKDKKKLEILCHSERFCNLDAITVRAIAVHIDREKLFDKVDKEDMEMCQAFDELMEDMRAEGQRQGKISIIQRMLEEGMENSLIYKLTECTREEMETAMGQKVML